MLNDHSYWCVFHIGNQLLLAARWNSKSATSNKNPHGNKLHLRNVRKKNPFDQNQPTTIPSVDSLKTNRTLSRNCTQRDATNWDVQVLTFAFSTVWIWRILNASPAVDLVMTLPGLRKLLYDAQALSFFAKAMIWVAKINDMICELKPITQGFY